MIALLFLACGAPQLSPEELPTCGRAPNCVSSLAGDEPHRVDALPVAAVADLERAVLLVPGCVVAQRSPAGLVAHCTTPSGLYTDDLVLRVDSDSVQIYSASRVGWSDVGMNRKRVEKIRTELAAIGG